MRTLLAEIALKRQFDKGSRYRRFFRAFLLQRKKRKRGKQEITSKAKIKNINDTLQSVMKQAKPAQRGKKEIASKAKIKHINDTLQSVIKQAKPARRGKQGAAQRSV